MTDCKVLSGKVEDEYDIGTLDQSSKIRAAQKAIEKKKLAKRQSVLQAEKLKDILAYIPEDKEGSKGFLRSIIAEDFRVDKPENSPISLEAKSEGIIKLMHKKLVSFMEEMQPKHLGMTQKKDFHMNVVREIGGVKTNNEAAGIVARSYMKMKNELRARFNYAGGGIPDRPGLDIPQFHDPVKVSKVDFHEWSDYIMNRLDYKSMEINKHELSLIIKDIYDNIVTDGLHKMEPGVPKGAKMSNRHMNSRFFIFKDPESWIDYSQRFGNENIYASMMDEMTTMSKEIAAMEMFGPNPDSTFRHISDVVAKRSGKADVAQSAQKQWDNYMGRNITRNRLGDIMQTIRNGETAVHLGSAMLSAPPDVMFNALTSKFNGLPVTRTLASFFKNLVHLQDAGKLAGELALGMDHAIDAAHTASRMTEISGGSLSARAASGIIRLSGLNYWSVAGKTAFGENFMQVLSKGKFNTHVIEAMKRYGINESDIGVIAKAPRETIQGVDYINWNHVPTSIAEKFVGMVAMETKMAVPEQTLKGRAIVNQGIMSGTVIGEMVRTGTQFWSFPVQIVVSHVNRALSMDVGSKMSYFGSLIVGSTILGAISIQAKEIADGRNPIPWDNPKLWSRGFIQGGALGAAGDMIFNQQTKYGGSLIDMVPAPFLKDLDKIVLPILDSAYKASDYMMTGKGNLEDPKQELLKTLGKVPTDFNPLSTLWYTRVLMDRSINDAIYKMTDENYVGNWWEREDQRYQEFGNKPWSNPQ